MCVPSWCPNICECLFFLTLYSRKGFSAGFGGDFAGYYSPFQKPSLFTSLLLHSLAFQFKIQLKASLKSQKTQSFFLALTVNSCCFFFAQFPNSSSLLDAYPKQTARVSLASSTHFARLLKSFLFLLCFGRPKRRSPTTKSSSRFSKFQAKLKENHAPRRKSPSHRN